MCVFRQDAYTSRECLGNPSGVLGIGERRGIELVIELRVRRLGFDSGLEEGDAAFGVLSSASTPPGTSREVDLNSKPSPRVFSRGRSTLDKDRPVQRHES